MKAYLALLFLIGTCLVCQSQEILTHRLDGTEEGKALAEYLREFEATHAVKIFFLDSWMSSLKIQKSQGLTLDEALKKTLQGTDISYSVMYGYALIFAKDPQKTLERWRFTQSVKSESKKIENQTIGKKESSIPGASVDLRGVVKDGKNQSPLAGAVVRVKDGPATVTSPDGSFSLPLSIGEHFVVFQYSNYDEKVVNIDIYQSGEILVELNEVPTVLDEVIVTGRQANAVTSNVGQIDIKMAQLKKLPTFLGEVDVMKQIQVLPGVTSVGEMSSGFNVRGGGADQNLILYDGVQLFNPSHVFGFFSAFNSDAIKNASFYKGGIPAEFGGRVSSVMNISSREGDYRKWSATGGVGPISANVSVNGPIQKDKSSLYVSLRSSYSDWLIKSLTYQNINKSSVSFYDASLKFAHKFNERDKITFSGYASQDKFGLPSDTSFSWHNQIASAQYDHAFSSRAFSTITIGYGSYGYAVTDQHPSTAYDLKYSITYPSLKADFNYQIGRHKLNTGVNAIWYGINPGSIVPTSPVSNVKATKIAQEQGVENAFFLEDEWEIDERIRVNGGVRLSAFTALGPQKVDLYQSGQPRSATSIVDSVTYVKGKPVKSYFGFEPRFSLVYKLSSTTSVKFGYNRIFQYIHLISNSVSITPIDIWQPSNFYFKPQIGDQYSVGVFHSSRNGQYEFSVEGFYKYTQNILDFKDGASIILNPNLEQALLTGVAKSYGTEFSAKKNTGRLQGSANYTYARSLRQVKGQFPGQAIDNGNFYPSNYDQPHIANLTWRYDVSRRFSFTGNFTYRTGRPITLPYSYSVVDHVPVVNYSDRNMERIPDYHRLDLSLVIEGNHRRNKVLTGSWIVSIYNVYARKNVYSVFYKANSDGVMVPYQLSIIGTILPSISYRFKI